MQLDGYFICLSRTKRLKLSLIMEEEDRYEWVDDESGELLCTISVHEDQWWFENGEHIQLPSQPIKWNELYAICWKEEPCFLHAISSHEGMRAPQLVALNKQRIIIGRKQGDIQYDHPHISNLHASLEWIDNAWWILDNHSANGVYVNDLRVTKERIQIADRIDLMGLTLLMGHSFLWIQHSEGAEPIISLPVFQPSEPRKELPTADQPMEYLGQPYEPFRFPTLTIKSPPVKQTRDRQPLILMLGPSITMSVASLTSCLFMVQSIIANGQSMVSAMPSLMMACSMLIGTLVWPWIAQRYELRKEHEQEEKRLQLYQAYLQKQQSSIHEIAHAYEAWLWQFDVQKQERNQWCLQFPSDQLCLVLGSTTQSLLPLFTQEDQSLELNEDPLMKLKQEFIKQRVAVNDVPFLLTLTSLHHVQIIGEEVDCYAYITMLLLCHVMLYAPHQTCLIICCSATCTWDYPHFLPHQFDEDGYRFLCHDPANLPSLLMHLHRKHCPALVISLHACYTSFFVHHAKELPICLLTLHDKDAPERIRLQKNTGVYETAARRQPFSWTPISKEQAVYTQLSQSILEQMKDPFPQTLSLLELFQVRTIQQLPVEERWQEHDSEYCLRAPIGVMADGETLELDLHEKAHGPHGICAGMTGSGKSELLISLVCSLAVSYHPYDCAFILIDYKGGGMAKTLEGLPHCAGIITNLDGSLIQRSLNSLNAELLRRQTLFAKTLEEQGSSTMDIDHYQKLFHDGTVTEPLPHLVIVADEFAELKQQEPQFMEQLIRMARIGRSLGIHLILATQKPSGVVDDQIWSNARFHLCLKVAQQEDSMDMLKRADGASIKAAGRFYLQVGYDEIFTQGQSAYTKGPYDPKRTVAAASVIRELAEDGSILHTWQRPQQQMQKEAEIAVLIRRLQEAANRMRHHPIRLWLDVLPAMLPSSQCIDGCIAMADDPAHQRQFPLLAQDCFRSTLLFAQDLHNAFVWMEVMLFQLMRQHSAQRRLVLLDFDRGELQPYAQMVYAALRLDDEEDLYFLMEEIARTRDQWEWVLFLHHAAAFFDTYEDAQQWVLKLIRDQGNCKVTIFMSATSMSNLTMRLYQQFPQIFVFHLHDESEAHLMIPGEWTLPSYPLRSMWKQDDRMAEVQIVTCDQPFPRRRKSLPKMPQLPKHLYDNDPRIQSLAKKEIPLGIKLCDRTMISWSLDHPAIVSGPEGKAFFDALSKRIKQHHLNVICNSAWKGDAWREDHMHLLYIPPQELSQLHNHEVIQACRMEARILWCGKGWEELRYLWNYHDNVTITQKKDGCLIGEEVIAIRRIEERRIGSSD